MPTADSVETKHPHYDDISPDWVMVRDCAEGEREIKGKREVYLSTTSGMRLRGLGVNQEGFARYNAYLKRAVFPHLVRPAVNALVGVMHREAAVIELPEQMEALRENATLRGESLLTLLRRINEAQIMLGRIGLMADVPTGDPTSLPYIVTYEAEHIINWDESRRKDGRNRLDLVVLDESTEERTSNFGWEMVRKFLVLDLVDPVLVSVNLETDSPIPPQMATVYRSRLEIDDSTAKAKEQLNRDTEVTSGEVKVLAGVTPKFRGKVLEEIPFVFIGSVDLTPEPDQVPMLGLSHLSLTIYRGEADYRHTLFMQGQDTLVVIGEQQGEGKTGDRLTGAEAAIELPIGADAKYIGVSSDGLTEQREALDNDRNHASELGANLLASSKGAQKEAEETLKIRVAARTASITSIVQAGAEGLQTILRKIAVWIGADENKVKVIPNMDFVPDVFLPKELMDFTAAKNSGAPIAWKSIHGWMVRKGVTELDFKGELKEIGKEEPFGPEPEEDPEEVAARTLMMENFRTQNQPPGGPQNLPPGNQPPGNQEPGNEP